MTSDHAPPHDFIFLHGGGQGSWVWEPVVHAMTLQAGEGAFRALALDVPGCGSKRGRDTSKLTIADVIAELADDIDKAGFANAVIVGHSQAGTVLPGLIASRGDLFRRAVYVACCAPARGQTVMEMMGAGRHGEHHDSVGWPEPLDAMPFPELAALMFCNDMDDVQRGSFLPLLDQDAWPAACGGADRDWRYDPAGRMESTYIFALADNALPLAWQARFAERLGVDRTVSIDAGHQIMQTRPRALAEMLLAESKR